MTRQSPPITMQTTHKLRESTGKTRSISAIQDFARKPRLQRSLAKAFDDLPFHED